jgi:hypothetical protein
MSPFSPDPKARIGIRRDFEPGGHLSCFAPVIICEIPLSQPVFTL